MRRKRRRQSRLSTFSAGLIGIVVIIVFSYLAYTKFANPFANPYTIHAVFSNANGVRPGSPVRIAGVNVGSVTSVSAEPGCRSSSSSQPACHAAELTMTIQNEGLPIHDDATFAIRPRIFLEGNFFVDVTPGTPSTPTAGDGHTFPIQQGVEPVQLDQVLTSLQADTRRNLQILLQQFGTAVKRGGPAYNASIQYWLPAYKYTSIVAHDALGIQPNDLSTYLAQQGNVASALDAHPQNLKSLITDFNTTANSFARVNTSLEATIAELPKTLAAAIPALDALNSDVVCGPPFCASRAPFRQLVLALKPGVKTTGPAIDASLPFITQLRLLVRPSELRGLTSDLSVSVPSLAKLTRETIPLMRDQVRPAASCVANVIYPWSQLTLVDPHFSAANGFPARKVYVEAVDYLPGLAGESRTFDANGPFIKIIGVGGSVTYSMQPGLFGQSLTKITAVQPQVPPGARRPPYKPTVPCETQAPITTLSTPSGAPPSPIPSGLTSLAAKAYGQGMTQDGVQGIAALSKLQGVKVTLGGKPVSP
jgi:phospholipid/cholesterol/gamma-HCH transport system substrate-binding protein